MDISEKREFLRKSSPLELKPFEDAPEIKSSAEPTEQKKITPARKTRRTSTTTTTTTTRKDQTTDLESLKRLMIYKMVTSPKVQGQIKVAPKEFLQQDTANATVGDDGLSALRPEEAAQKLELSTWGQQVEAEIRQEATDKLFENPLTGQRFSPDYWRLKKNTDLLPTTDLDHQLYFLRLLDNYGLILLQGETGSGKTTQLPRQVLRYLGWGKNNKGPVICTQPRQLNTELISQYVAKTMDVGPSSGGGTAGGSNLPIVGYLHRDNQFYNPTDTKLLYITDGTLIEKILRNPLEMFTYGAVIIDEVHERSVAIDLLLLFIKQAIHWQQNPTEGASVLGAETMNHLKHMKFLIMSATIDLDTYARYFSGYQFAVAKIPGRSCRVVFNNNHMIIPYYENIRPRSNLWEQIYNELGKILTTVIESPTIQDICTDTDDKTTPVDDQRQDVLVFLPTIQSIHEAKRHLNIHLDNNILTKLEFRMLYANRPDLQQEMLKDTTSGKTKIILATNVAETGITVPGISYVIDTGLKLESGYEPSTRIASLTLNYITRSEVAQRAGRAGRVKDGLYYRLYSNHVVGKRSGHPTPQIRRSDLSYWFLKLLQLADIQTNERLQEVLTQEMITPVTTRHFTATWNYLQRLGILNQSTLAFLGECLLPLGLEIEQASLLLLNKGLTAGTLVNEEKLSVLVMILNLGGNVIGKWIYNSQIQNDYRNNDGDLFGLYQLYEDWNNGQLAANATKFNVRYLQKVKTRSRQLRQKMRELDSNCRLTPNFDPVADWKMNLKNMLKQIYGEGTSGGLLEKKNDRYHLDQNPVKQIRLEKTLLGTLTDNVLSLNKRRLGQFVESDKGVIELTASWLINLD